MRAAIAIGDAGLAGASAAAPTPDRIGVRAGVVAEVGEPGQPRLGPGAVQGLARTADLLRADADALDSLAAAEVAGLGGAAAAGEQGWPVADLAALPAAVRHRVLRQAAIAAGSPPGGLSQRHVASLDELVTSWHGQRWADLPGGVRGERRYGRLLLSRTSGPEVTPLATTARSEEPGGRE